MGQFTAMDRDSRIVLSMALRFLEVRSAAKMGRAITWRLTSTLLAWLVSTLAAILVTVIAAFAAAEDTPTDTIPSTKAATANDPTVYEPGELYLARCRVYVFVGKTGFGHEHGVEGQIKQGMIRLDNPHNCGQLVFDMSTFAADTSAAREYVRLVGTEDASSQQQVTDTNGTVEAVSCYHSMVKLRCRTIAVMSP
jgi:hypothetical protein